MHYEFLNDNVPQEHTDRIDMAAELLRRCTIVVVCGTEVDEQVKNDIALAKRQHIVATTLDGILTHAKVHKGDLLYDSRDQVR